MTVVSGAGHAGGLRRLLAAAALAVLLTPVPAVAQDQGVVGPGITYRSIHRDASQVYVAEVTLSAASTPTTVLAGGRLGSVETTSSMAGRVGAVLAVNGDFGLSTGRPVHAFASGGLLVQGAQLAGRGVGLPRGAGAVQLGDPVVNVTVSHGGQRLTVPRWNSGPPVAGGLAGFTAAGGTLEVAPAHDCYAVLTPRSAPAVGTGGRVDTRAGVVGQGCAATAPAVPAHGAVLVATPGSRGAAALAALPTGAVATLSPALGFAGTWSLLGASEALVVGGRVNGADVDQPGAYVQDPAPRTAVGTTADGRLVVVVVDGRQPGYSAGVSLRQLARLLVALGAQQAVNLDGGGSSTMWVRGRVVNRPSDGAERAVSSALVVLPGRAATGIGTAPADSGPADPGPAVPGPADRDAASTGGLADALARRGVALGPALAAADEAFRAG